MAWDDLATPLINAFGETVLYRPHEGAERSIRAIVDRFPEGSIEGLDGTAPKAVLTVVNDPVFGVRSDDFKQGDAFEFALIVGQEPAARYIRLPLVAHDSYTCKVGVH